jgi:hypothetical protein
MAKPPDLRESYALTGDAATMPLARDLFDRSEFRTNWGTGSVNSRLTARIVALPQIRVTGRYGRVGLL